MLSLYSQYTYLWIIEERDCVAKQLLTVRHGVKLVNAGKRQALTRCGCSDREQHTGRCREDFWPDASAKRASTCSLHLTMLRSQVAVPRLVARRFYSSSSRGEPERIYISISSFDTPVAASQTLANACRRASLAPAALSAPRLSFRYSTLLLRIPCSRSYIYQHPFVAMPRRLASSFAPSPI